MPKVRKLSHEEVRQIEKKNKGQRRMVEEEYDTFLSDYGVGEYGEAELDEEENRITVRNRLKAAATRRGLSLDFKRTKGNTLRFRVVESQETGAMSGSNGNGSHAPEPEPVQQAPARTTSKGRGRGKKRTGTNND